MAQRTRTILKGYFNTGDVPTEAQFADFIDSTHNISEDGTPLTEVTWDDVTGKPAEFTPTTHTHTIAHVTGLQLALDQKATAAQGVLADSALQPGASIPWATITGAPALFDGAYASLTGVPATFAPSAHTHSATEVVSGTFANARISQVSVTQHQAALSIAWSQVTGAPAFLTAVAWGDVTGKPTFATVATSGAYSDLTGLPSLFDGTWTSLTGKPNVVESDTTGITGADQITNAVSLTQAEYDAIGTPNASTLYVIVG